MQSKIVRNMSVPCQMSAEMCLAALRPHHAPQNMPQKFSKT